MYSAFQYNQFLLRRQVFALTGKFRIYSPTGELVLFSQQKMFKLREDIRLYTDESKSQEVLNIKARSIIDFSAAYDVLDCPTNEKVGTWRRKGLRSMLRDEWELLDANDRLIGSMYEDSMALALVRRFVAGKWLPQNYDLFMNEERVADLKQRFNLLRYEMDIDLTMDTARQLDPRLAVAGAILLATIEGKQE
jgi:uncharacterized protein YxjI